MLSQVSVTVFVAYVYSMEDHYLAPSIAFVAMSLIDNLRGSMGTVPHLISHFIKVSSLAFLTCLMPSILVSVMIVVKKKEKKKERKKERDSNDNNFENLKSDVNYIITVIIRYTFCVFFLSKCIVNLLFIFRYLVHICLEMWEKKKENLLILKNKTKTPQIIAHVIRGGHWSYFLLGELFQKL